MASSVLGYFSFVVDWIDKFNEFAMQTKVEIKLKQLLG